MKVSIGSDHAGYNLKTTIIDELKSMGHDVEDEGTSGADVPANYPEIAGKVATKVSVKSVDRGILICGSGIGMAMTANKYKGVRAFVGTSETHARLARQHNDANLLAMGERTTGNLIAVEILKVFLGTEFEGGRHQKRVDMMDSLCSCCD